MRELRVVWLLVLTAAACAPTDSATPSDWSTPDANCVGMRSERGTAVLSSRERVEVFTPRSDTSEASFAWSRVLLPSLEVLQVRTVDALPGAFAPDGERFLVALEHGVRVLSPDAAQTFSFLPEDGFERRILAAAWTADGLPAVVFIRRPTGEPYASALHVAIGSGGDVIDEWPTRSVTLDAAAVDTRLVFNPLGDAFVAQRDRVITLPAVGTPTVYALTSPMWGALGEPAVADDGSAVFYGADESGSSVFSSVRRVTSAGFEETIKPEASHFLNMPVVVAADTLVALLIGNGDSQIVELHREGPRQWTTSVIASSVNFPGTQLVGARGAPMQVLILEEGPRDPLGLALTPLNLALLSPTDHGYERAELGPLGVLKRVLVDGPCPATGGGGSGTCAGGEPSTLAVLALLGMWRSRARRRNQRARARDCDAQIPEGRREVYA